MKMSNEVPVVPTANPGSLAEVSVAPSWREFRPEVEDSSQVDPVVILFCPEGALSWQEGLIEVNLKICKGCGICAAESAGIVMVPEYTGVPGIFGVKEVNK